MSHTSIPLTEENNKTTKRTKQGKKHMKNAKKKKIKKNLFEEGTSETIMLIGLHQVTHSRTSVANFVWPPLV